MFGFTWDEIAGMAADFMVGPFFEAAARVSAFDLTTWFMAGNAAASICPASISIVETSAMGIAPVCDWELLSIPGVPVPGFAADFDPVVDSIFPDWAIKKLRIDVAASNSPFDFWLGPANADGLAVFGVSTFGVCGCGSFSGVFSLESGAAALAINSSNRPISPAGVFAAGSTVSCSPDNASLPDPVWMVDRVDIRAWWLQGLVSAPAKPGAGAPSKAPPLWPGPGPSCSKYRESGSPHPVSW